MAVALARRDAGQSVRPRLFREVAMDFLRAEETARRVAVVDPARAKEHAARQVKKRRDQRHSVEKHLLPFLTGRDADGKPVADDSPDRYPRPNPVLTIDGLTADFLAGYEDWRQDKNPTTWALARARSVPSGLWPSVAPSSFCPQAKGLETEMRTTARLEKLVELTYIFGWR